MNLKAKNESTQQDEEFLTLNAEIEFSDISDYDIEICDEEDNVLFAMKPTGLVAKFKIRKKNVN